MTDTPLTVAVLSIHSSPVGPLGTRDTGGMSVYVRELARELGRLGHRIDIFTRSTAAGPTPVVALAPNVRLIHLDGGPPGVVAKRSLPTHLPELARSLDAFRRADGRRYDLIHSHYWLSGRVGSWIRTLWDVPHLVTFHTLGAVKNRVHGDEGEPTARIEAERRLVAEADRLLVAAAREREHLVRWYGAPGAKIAVIPCGVNLERFRPAAAGPVRARLGMEPGEALLLYVGRFAPLKGLDRLLEALLQVRERRPARLLIVGGDGPEDPATRALRRQADALGLGPAVTFAGRIDQPDLPPYYGAADLLVVPSHYESFGLVALEALACGTPVVATPVGAMEAVLADGRAGTVVADATPAALAAGIEAVLARNEADRATPEAVRATVLEYGWPRVAAAVGREYAALVGSPGGAAESAGTLAAAN